MDPSTSKGATQQQITPGTDTVPGDEEQVAIAHSTYMTTGGLPNSYLFSLPEGLRPKVVDSTRALDLVDYLAQEKAGGNQHFLEVNPGFADALDAAADAKQRLDTEVVKAIQSEDYSEEATEAALRDIKSAALEMAQYA